MKTIEERIDKTDTCWNWIGELSGNGYGRLQIGGKRMAAHRLLYTQHKGEIPEGFEVDHLCRNRRCVNPDHLEAVTPRENKRRARVFWVQNTPNCRHGHPYSGDNLYMAPYKSKGFLFRSCKTCKNAATLRWIERNKNNPIYRERGKKARLKYYYKMKSQSIQ